MTTSVRFESVKIRDFRNVSAIDFEPGFRINVISGDNGQGKTSLLEALYAVATSRSFRADRPRELLRDGAEVGTVRAKIDENGFGREQVLAVSAARRTVRIDGKKPESLSAYATRTPIVVFHPGNLALVAGSAGGRRTLLDRIALFEDPASGDHRTRYDRALRSRQAALEERGPRAADLDVLEELVAEHGAAVSTARSAASVSLTGALAPIFEKMAPPGLKLVVRFVPGGPPETEALLAELRRNRGADLRRGRASSGPHRDELELELDGRTVRRHASQGQQRIVTLALKAAELACVKKARGAEPVLLLDDVSSELDPDRTGAVYEFLRETPSQIFVTTTRPELFSLSQIPSGERADFRVVGGALAGVA